SEREEDDELHLCGRVPVREPHGRDAVMDRNELIEELKSQDRDEDLAEEGILVEVIREWLDKQKVDPFSPRASDFVSDLNALFRKHGLYLEPVNDCCGCDNNFLQVESLAQDHAKIIFDEGEGRYIPFEYKAPRMSRGSLLSTITRSRTPGSS